MALVFSKPLLPVIQLALPELATIVTTNISGNQQTFNPDIPVIPSLIFAAVVGLMIAIQQWEQKPHPWIVFIAALAIPSLVASGTGQSKKSLQMVQLDNSAAIRIEESISTGSVEVDGDTQVPVEQWREFQIIPVLPKIPDQSGSLDFFITRAYAQNTAKEVKVQSANPMSLGILKSRQPQALIILKKFKSKNEADLFFPTIKTQLPDAALVKAGNEFLLLESLKAQSFWNAAKRAKQLGKSMEFQPKLLAVPPSALKN